MPIKFIMEKQKSYPRPHSDRYGWSHTLEAATLDYDSTIVPFVHYDEALGAPDGYQANPEHGSFAAYGGTNCYPDSRIENVEISIRIWLSKSCLVTDAIDTVRLAYMPITTTFEDLDALDEKSSQTIGTLIEMQDEATDNQAGPLYNTVDMLETFTDHHNMAVQNPFLTATPSLEAVAWNSQNYYNALQYFATAAKLATCTRGLKWITLTKRHPYVKLKFHVPKKNKRMVKKSFWGCLVHVPFVDTDEQMAQIGDTTAELKHVNCQLDMRYYEWNPEFDMGRV